MGRYKISAISEQLLREDQRIDRNSHLVFETQCDEPVRGLLVDADDRLDMLFTVGPRALQDGLYIGDSERGVNDLGDSASVQLANRTEPSCLFIIQGHETCTAYGG